MNSQHRGGYVFALGWIPLLRLCFSRVKRQHRCHREIAPLQRPKPCCRSALPRVDRDNQRTNPGSVLEGTRREQTPGGTNLDSNPQFFEQLWKPPSRRERHSERIVVIRTGKGTYCADQTRFIWARYGHGNKNNIVISMILVQQRKQLVPVPVPCIPYSMRATGNALNYRSPYQKLSAILISLIEIERIKPTTLFEACPYFTHVSSLRQESRDPNSGLWLVSVGLIACKELTSYQYYKHRSD